MEDGDYRELGMAYDAPAVRVSRLEESVRPAEAPVSEEQVDHTGEHYTVRGAKVVHGRWQRPHPPLMIAAAGRAFSLAARQPTSSRSRRR